MFGCLAMVGCLATCGCLALLGCLAICGCLAPELTHIPMAAFSEVSCRVLTDTTALTRVSPLLVRVKLAETLLSYNSIMALCRVT